MKLSLHTLILCCLAIVLKIVNLQAQTPQWTGIGPADESFSNEIRSICSDSSGNIYAGGWIANASGNGYIAKWDGSKWSELGGANSFPHGGGLIVSICSDPAGNIYAVGFMADSNGREFVAKWDGSGWSELGGVNSFPSVGIGNGVILSVCSDAAGNVYAAGGFFNASGRNFVAKWDGNAWSELGGANALNPNGNILAVCSDAQGNIYAGGNFANVNGKHYIAKWDGIAWSELGGTNALSANDKINSICTDASGNIYAAGEFYNTSLNKYVAKWDGTAWSELGGTNAMAANDYILSTCTDALGNIYAAGQFTNANGKRYVAKWDGSIWSEIGVVNPFSAYDNITSLCRDIAGNIYSSGYFTNASLNNYVAKWDGTAWSELGATNALSANNRINSICVDSSGNLYSAGNMTNVNGKYYVAQWDGATWSELGGTNALSANSIINSICSDSFGSIYAAGDFINDSSYKYVAKWDGIAWSELGGTNALSANNQILTTCLDATGNFYAAGHFTNASGKRYVAKWDGTNWSELGGINALSANLSIRSICSDNSGNIYAAGSFTNASGKRYVAKWDGSTWSELGGVNSLAANNIILSVCSDVSGNIYTAGEFSNGLTSGYGTKYVAKWDGNAWSELGGTNALAANDWIYCVYSDASGNIYAAGEFTNGVNTNSSSNYVAKWDGSVWSELWGLTNLGDSYDIINSICSDVSGNIYATVHTQAYPSGRHRVSRYGTTTISTTGSTTFCEGDSVTLSGNSDGIWSNGSTSESITVSTSGTYSVLSSNGNIMSNSIVVTVIPLPVAPTISSIGNATICPGSPVTLTGNNGSTWSDGSIGNDITVNTAGSYYIVSSNNCGIDTSNIVTIDVSTFPIAPSISAMGNTTICEGNSVMLIGNNGSTWSNGAVANDISVSAAGNYFVVNTNNCGSDTSNIISVIVNPLPMAPNITSIGNTTFCLGDSLVLAGNNGGIWSNGTTASDITINTTGNYYVVSSNSCGSDTSNIISVTVNPLPNNSVTQSNNTLTINQTSASYQWLNCDNNYQLIPNDTNQIFVANANGNYAALITQNGCVDTSVCYSIIITGIANSPLNETVTLYPNPANSSITISGAMNETISIQNTLGQIIYFKQNCTTLETIDVSGFVNGIYMVRTNQTSIKFIKQ